MRKLILGLFLAAMPVSLWATAGSSDATLVVSTGNYKTINGYSQSAGEFRQAIIIGDQASSDTAHVIIGQGMQVFLGTSAASGVGTLTGITNPVTVTITTVTQSLPESLKTISFINASSNTVVLGAGTAAFGKLSANSGVDIGDVDVTSVSGNVTVIQPSAPSLKASVLIDGTSNTVQITGTPTVNAAQSGTWTVQPGNTQNTTPWLVQQANTGVGTSTVTFSNVGQPVTSTSTWVVNKTTVAVQVQDVTGALVSVGYQSSGSSVPVQIQNAATNPVLIQSTGTLSVAIVAGAAAGGTSSSYISAFPSAGTAAGFVGPIGGLMQGARVDVSSNIYVNQINIATVTYNGTTQPVSIQNASTTTFNNVGQPVTSTSTYITNVTTSPIQIQTGAGTLVGVGYQSGGGSIPVQIIGTITQNVVSTQTLVTSTSALPMGIQVSSTALPTAPAQGSTMTVTGDSMGRIFVTGTSYGQVSSTWSVNVSTGTGEIILISSPTAPLRTYMCGCILKNTSATNSGITLYNTRSNLTTFASYPIGAPANYIPAGIWPGCQDPFFVGAIGGQIVFKADAAATSTQMTCQYFQGP